MLSASYFIVELIVVMLNVVMLNVVNLNVVAPSLWPNTTFNWFEANFLQGSML